MLSCNTPLEKQLKPIIFEEALANMFSKCYRCGSPCSVFYEQARIVCLRCNENTYLSIVVPTLLEKIPDPVRLMITRGEDYLNWTVRCNNEYYRQDEEPE